VSRLLAWSDWLVLRFNAWFCSRAGVWRTLFVVLGLVVAEQIRPHWDEHGFWLLFALTVYSGVTQPALAVAGQEAARRLEAMQLEHRLLLVAVQEVAGGLQRLEEVAVVEIVELRARLDAQEERAVAERGRE
jgi:hypothetical protein